MLIINCDTDLDVMDHGGKELGVECTTKTKEKVNKMRKMQMLFYFIQEREPDQTKFISSSSSLIRANLDIVWVIQ